MSIRDGAMYYWPRGAASDPTNALAVRAVTLQSIATGLGYDPDAIPVKSSITLLSQNDRHLLAFGAVPYGSTDVDDFDPLLIRWANQDVPSQWTPTPLNSAGDIRCSRGSRIVGAFPTRQQILVWTDSNLYALQFLGTTDVFSIQEYADFTSIMSTRAMVTANDITFWMGRDKFYAYDGRVRALDCTIRDHVFNEINLDQGVQCVSGTNEEWNEVWWFYTSGESLFNDKYAVYNYKENIWYHGDIERTAWLDSSLYANPLACNTDVATGVGYIYQHEDGLDADGAAMESHITSNDFDLGDGERYMLTRRIIPDVDFDKSTAGTPTITMEVRSRNFPGSSYRDDVADTQTVTNTSVDIYTNEVFVRARARQMAIKIASTDAGVTWRLGAPRLDARQDGRQ